MRLDQELGKFDKIITLFARVNFFLALVVIEVLATTGRAIPALDNIWDKGKHSFAFFVLSILFAVSYRNLHLFKTQSSLLFLFGVQIELVQYFLPQRFFSVNDVLANFVGIALGLLIISVVKKFLLPKLFVENLANITNEKAK